MFQVVSVILFMGARVPVQESGPTHPFYRALALPPSPASHQTGTPGPNLPLASASDIWWPLMETCSNLFA